LLCKKKYYRREIPRSEKQIPSADTRSCKEASSYKYFGIHLSSDLSWDDPVNYKVKNAWKALHFTIRILKMETFILKV
jgi:hypothetical protein